MYTGIYIILFLISGETRALGDDHNVGIIDEGTANIDSSKIKLKSKDDNMGFNGTK